MANDYIVTGKVIAIQELQIGDSKKRPGEKWHKQDYVLETLEEWPKKIAFNIWGEDRIKQANIQMGEVITLHFTVESREYNGRWYTDIRGQMVEKGNNSGYGTPSYGTPQNGFQPPYPPQGQSYPSQSQPNYPSQQSGYGNGFGGEQVGQDDLPF